MIKQSFRNFSVLKKNQIIFSTILTITLSCYGLVFYYSSKQKNDAVLVDISGKNRMLSQRIGAMAQLIGCAEEDISEKAKEELTKALNAHDAALKALKEGGELSGVEGELPASSGKIREKISEIQEFFSKHKEYSAVLVNVPSLIEKTNDSGKTYYLPNPVFQKSLKEMQKRLINGTLLKHNIELTGMFVEKAALTQSSFLTLLVVLLIMNIASIIAGYKLFHTFITVPVSYLSDISAKIAQGDAGVQSNYTSGDDIGRISNSINILTNNLRKAANFTMKLGKGDFSAQLDIVVAENTVEEQNLAMSLLNMKHRLMDVALVDQKRNWVSEGLAMFGDFLRNNHDVKAFSEVVVRELVKYLKANQAGLFIANGEGAKTRLELTACYAYDRKKYEEKSFRAGEGLIGQAYLDQDIIYMTEVPDDYATITSGLGMAKPKSILLLPLKNNDRIEGVFEIASLKPFDEFDIQFLKKAAENMAGALYHIKINEHTRILLEESQTQSEELRAQEEEMRQNMEELSATQEELSRKEKRYLEVIDELKIENEKLKAT